MARNRRNAVIFAPEAHEIVIAEPKVQNIVDLYMSATPEDIAEGTLWYADAYTLAITLDPANPAAAAGVIAAMSPITPWGRNKDLAERAYRDGAASGTLSRNCDKANEIMAGADPLDVLKGEKVVNFYLSIIGDQNAVCIDRHAYDIAVGTVTNDVSRDKALRRKGEYDKIAALYREAAERIGILPSELQAITWTIWRRLKGL